MCDKDSSKFQSLMPMTATMTVIGSCRSSSFLTVVGTKSASSLRREEIEVRVMRWRSRGPKLGVSAPALRRLHQFQHAAHWCHWQATMCHSHRVSKHHWECLVELRNNDQTVDKQMLWVTATNLQPSRQVWTQNSECRAVDTNLSKERLEPDMLVASSC